MRRFGQTKSTIERQRDFEDFAQISEGRLPQEQIAGDLHGNGRGAARDAFVAALVDHLAQSAPIDAMMPAEMRILGRDDRSDEIGRDGAQRNSDPFDRLSRDHAGEHDGRIRHNETIDDQERGKAQNQAEREPQKPSHKAAEYAEIAGFPKHQRALTDLSR